MAQRVERDDHIGGAAAVAVDRAAVADGLVHHDPLGDHRLPDRLLADDPGQLVVPAFGFPADRRYPVDDDTAELELGVVAVPDVVDQIGDGPDAAQPE
ncbi:MAG: hypothetical protein R2713_04930 [Ilumatobacteraceae bacterium]